MQSIRVLFGLVAALLLVCRVCGDVACHCYNPTDGCSQDQAICSHVTGEDKKVQISEGCRECCDANKVQETKETKSRAAGAKASVTVETKYANIHKKCETLQTEMIKAFKKKGVTVSARVADQGSDMDAAEAWDEFYYDVEIEAAKEEKARKQLTREKERAKKLSSRMNGGQSAHRRYANNYYN